MCSADAGDSLVVCVLQMLVISLCMCVFCRRGDSVVISLYVCVLQTLVIFGDSLCMCVFCRRWVILW